MKTKLRIKLFKSKGQWFFRVVANNGRIVAQSEGYKQRQSCTNTAGLFCYAPPVIVYERTH